VQNNSAPYFWAGIEVSCTGNEPSKHPFMRSMDNKKATPDALLVSHAENFRPTPDFV
jgi:pyrroloquinoline quinone (PQQ) biosynthesis protein C